MARRSGIASRRHRAPYRVRSRLLYAIIAQVVGSAGHVTAIEIDPELAARATKNLAHLRNVAVVEADGLSYDPGRVDIIFMNAGVTHPQPLWLRTINIGGRLLIPITITLAVPSDTEASHGSDGHMLLVRRLPERYEAGFVGRLVTTPAPAGEMQPTTAFLGQLFRDTILGKRPAVKPFRQESHAIKSCWLHGEGFCLSTCVKGIIAPKARVDCAAAPLPCFPQTQIPIGSFSA